LASGDLGSLFQDRDPLLEVEALDGSAEKGRPASVGLKEMERRTGPPGRHDQTGEAAAGAEIDQLRRLRGQAPPDDGKALRVLNLMLQWAGAQESQGSGIRQDLEQKGGGGAPIFGAGHRRRVSPRER
jgi:hypothetical protein